MKQLLFGLILGLNLTAFAQTTPKEVLFTIDNKPYYTDEFLRVYNKNLDLVKDESQKDLNQYLDLFIGYKLKINKAHKLGLQDGEQYQNELNTYRAQLSKNYLTDSKVTKELVDEAYSRSLKEIRASHILITVDENALPQDTLAAYNKAIEIRGKALKGEDFATLASQFSQDPSAKENKGDLGYFSVFRMVYPFETAAYKTPLGQISKPVRSRFGYHVIKVNDIRENRGEVTVAHIMIMNPKTDDAAEKERVRTTINDIYAKLQQGENFETLARQFSEDKSSSSKGGVLNRFGSGQLSSEEFENVAFSLTKEAPVSQPFQSAFGWHIVKLVEKHPIKSADEMKAELENRISKDDRSRLIAASLNEKLKKKYAVKRDEKVYASVVKSVNDKIYEGQWEAPTGNQFDGNLFVIEDKPVPAKSFVNYLQTQQKSGNLTTKPTSKLTESLYQRFLDEQLNSHYNANLEKEFPEFANVMDEYRDGLLLFELMEKEIWERSKIDTIGLQKFYESNINNYVWKKRADVVLVSSTKEDVVKKAQKFLKQDKTPEYIKEKLNVSGVVNVMTNSGTFEEGADVLPVGFKFDKGVSGIVKDGEYYFVAKVNKVLPAGPKTLDEAKGRVINSYQQYLEENWVSDLKKEFTVSVNRSVFEKVKKQLHP
ncbi:MAG TPA: peptidylprolyl isomerase [Flavobacterium sp.]